MSRLFGPEIIREFRQCLGTEKEVDPRADAVVVLSIRPPHYNENIERIRYGWELLQRITALRVGKCATEVMASDLEQFAPLFILNGETECLADMEETAIFLGVPRKILRLLDSGDLSQANTKVNMKVLAEHPEFSSLHRLAFVTSGYHVPRTVRTAQRNLLPHHAFEVHAVPHGRFSYDVRSRVMSEIHRMRRYCEKGDITR